MRSFVSELAVYIGRIRTFTPEDWRVYTVWVGLMLGLTFSTLAFVAFAHVHEAPVPRTVWLVPIGAAIFTGAIAIDTIGHRTVYKVVIARAEQLVHGITIFCGIGSCILLCASYTHRDLFFVPATVLTILSFIYSFVDEAFHWHRYWTSKSDVVEMWSHVFILIGHGTMMMSWWSWCNAGYPGVDQVLSLLS